MSSREQSSAATGSRAVEGGVASSKLTSVTTGSGTIGGVLACSGGPSAGACPSCLASVVSSMGGSSFCSVGVGGLVCIAISLGFQAEHDLIIVKVLQQLLDFRVVGFDQGMIILC